VVTRKRRRQILEALADGAWHETPDRGALRYVRLAFLEDDGALESRAELRVPPALPRRLYRITASGLAELGRAPGPRLVDWLVGLGVWFGVPGAFWGALFWWVIAP